MYFRTELKAEQAFFSIQHQDNCIFLGSCFAEHMAQRMLHNGFSVLQNPFGILFNPMAIAQNLLRVLRAEPLPEKYLVEINGEWRSLLHHSKLNYSSKEKLLFELKKIDNSLLLELSKSKVLFITLGTAWVYKHKASGALAANCHKIPNTEFEKVLLTTTAIVDALKEMLMLLKSYNPALNVVLTISPVRHLKDGMVANNWSKSTLILAVAALVSHSDSIAYFPAYEWVMDDLRDYRFFEKDMLHPNQLAIDYIWEKFEQTYFTNETIQLNKQVIKYKKLLAHRPIHAVTSQLKPMVLAEISKFEQAHGIEIIK